MRSLSLKNGLLFNRNKAECTDIHIDEQGKLVALGSAPKDFKPADNLDLKAKWIVPYLSDISAHLTIPDRLLRADLKHELNCAFRSGITKILVKPDTKSIINHSDHIQQLYSACQDHPVDAKFCCSFADTENLNKFKSDLKALAQAGCQDIHVPTRANYTVREIEKLMIQAQQLDLRINLTAQNLSSAGTGCCHEGLMSASLGLDSIPVSAETTQLKMLLEIALHTGVRIHFSQVSSAQAIDIFAKAKQDNANISADVSIGHLCYTDLNIAGYDNLFHTAIPLRDATDQKALRMAVNQGIIDSIGSEHTPLLASHKKHPFPMTMPGMSTLDTFASQLIALILEGHLDRQAALNAISWHTCDLYDPTQKVDLQTGQPVSLTVLDPEKSQLWSASDILSSGKNNPAIGQRLPTRAYLVISQGQCQGLNDFTRN